MRGPAESYSDVILRLIEMEAGQRVPASSPSGVELAPSLKLASSAMPRRSSRSRYRATVSPLTAKGLAIAGGIAVARDPENLRQQR